MLAAAGSEIVHLLSHWQVIVTVVGMVLAVAGYITKIEIRSKLNAAALEKAERNITELWSHVNRLSAQMGTKETRHYPRQKQ